MTLSNISVFTYLRHNIHIHLITKEDGITRCYIFNTKYKKAKVTFLADKRKKIWFLFEEKGQKFLGSKTKKFINNEFKTLFK